MADSADRLKLRDRLYLSGIDGKAFDIALSEGFGFEMSVFCWAPKMEDGKALAEARRQAASGVPLWFHAPFAELIPCSVDPLARELTHKRLLQAMELSLSLGIKRIVMHGGFIPQVYYPEWYVEQSIGFWKNFLRHVPEDVIIALENVMEPGPQLLADIADGIDDPRIGLCFDTGHANSNVSSIPPLEWIDVLKHRLVHVHLHNNMGDKDLHAPLGEGIIPMETVLDRLIEREVTFTVENQDCRASLKWLEEKAYI